MSINRRHHRTDIIGLIPAAGEAKRISPLPFSKELFPLGFSNSEKNDFKLRPKVICHYLLEKMRFAGVTNIYFILRNGKWDIPSYLSTMQISHIHLAYLIVNQTDGVPYTLDTAYPFVQNSIVVFGFPDIVFRSRDAYRRLLSKQLETSADLVLGLFPVDAPEKWDMVDVDEESKIVGIQIKPATSELKYAWIIAVWTPTFTQFMHKYLHHISDCSTLRGGDERVQGRELFMGEVINAAIKGRIHVEYEVFPDDTCLDIGTPADLIKAVKIESQDF